MRQLNWNQYELEHSPDGTVVLHYRDRSGKWNVELQCGTHDDVDVFREGCVTYVLTRNDRLGYVGVEGFENGKLEGDLFLQDSQAVNEVLGRRGLDLAPMTIVKRMREHL